MATDKAEKDARVWEAGFPSLDKRNKPLVNSWNYTAQLYPALPSPLFSGPFLTASRHQENAKPKPEVKVVYVWGSPPP